MAATLVLVHGAWPRGLVFGVGYKSARAAAIGRMRLICRGAWDEPADRSKVTRGLDDVDSVANLSGGTI